MSEILRLIDFWRYQRMMIGQKTIVRPFHIKKAEALTDLMLGRLDTPNLMILEPPRFGKTDLGVKAFEPYALSYFPDSEFINGSVTNELATENTDFVRSTLSASWYREMCDDDFGANVAMRGEKASGRKDFFYTTAGGSVKGVGAGTAVIGFGAGKLRAEFGGAIVIDDPTKPQEINSPTIRKNTIDWIINGLYPRRNRQNTPKTPIILIQQRLHPQDAAGYLLATERDQWTVLQLDAEDEEGKSIWEDRISTVSLQHMKETNPDTYWAQYRQQPSDAMFRIFHDDWWRYWDNPLEIEKRITLKIITADTAFKEGDSNDFSVLQCWGFENTSAAYLLDQDKGKWEFPELIKHAKDFLKKHTTPRYGYSPAKEAWVEDKASGTSLVQSLVREGLPFRQWLPPQADIRVIEKFQQLPAPGKDKVARANQCTNVIYMGRVRLPYPGMQGYKWVGNFIGEHAAFTKDDSHLYDDQVDACTMALLIWQQRGGGTGPMPIWNKQELVWPPMEMRKAA